MLRNKEELFEGIGSFLLKSRVLKIVPSYPYGNNLKKKFNYKYQGVITGLYKDHLSGNLNLLIDLGLKEDLIVLRDIYSKYLSFFCLNSSSPNLITKLDLKQKKKVTITNYEKNCVSINFDEIFKEKKSIKFYIEKSYLLKSKLEL